MLIYLLKMVIFQFANCKRLPGRVMAGGTSIHFLAMALRPYVDVEPLLRQVVWTVEMGIETDDDDPWIFLHDGKSSNV